jgi:hypothetical protein
VTITPEEFAHVKKAIVDAEMGKATLPQLARAHHICERVGATDTLGEVRKHIRRYVPTPFARTEAKSVLLGVISGIITWFVLGRTKEAAM